MDRRRNSTPLYARTTLKIAVLEAASRGELDNPEAVIESLMPAADAFEADAREQLRALHSRLAEQQAAHEAERERWADEKARLIRQCQRAERDLVAISGCPQNGPLEDPHGFYVYYLWDHLQRILYIGRSANIFRRLGEHVLKRGIGIYRITTVQCPDAATMERLEMQAIAEHQPEWNVQGVSA